MILNKRRPKLAVSVLSFLVWVGLHCAEASAQTYLFSKINFPTGASPVAMAAGDFNGDGRLDLAVANGLSVSILLGNGDGTFQMHANYVIGFAPTPGPDSTPASLAVGDFNKDGNLDLAVTLSTGRDIFASFLIMLGNGDGTFRTSFTSELDLGFSLMPSVIAADLKGDGVLDLVIIPAECLSGACFIPSGVSVLLGNGDGTFEQPVDYSTTESFSVAAGDFNGDGKVDLAVSGLNTVSVLLGNGDGTFQSAVDYATAGGGPWVVTPVARRSSQRILTGMARSIWLSAASTTYRFCRATVMARFDPTSIMPQAPVPPR